MGTVVVGAIVVVVAGVAIRSIRKDKKSGKGCNGKLRKLRRMPLRLELQIFTYAKVIERTAVPEKSGRAVFSCFFPTKGEL